MKAKINKNIFWGQVILVFSLVAFNNFMYLFDVSFNKFNVILIAIFFGMIVCHGFEGVCKVDSIEKKIIICFFILFFTEAILSAVRYSQGIVDSLLTEKHYYSILLYYIFLKVYNDEKKHDILIDTYIIIALIICSLILLQVLIFHKLNIEFLYVTYYKRAGLVRMRGAAHFIEIGLLLAFSKLVDKKRNNKWKAIYYAMVVLGLINMFFVSMTRMSLVIVLITIMIIMFFKDTSLTRQTMIKRFLGLLGGVFFVVWLFNTEIVRALIGDFGVYNVTVTDRVREILFMTNDIFDSFYNFIFGTGLISESKESIIYQMFGGLGKNSRTDVGLLGFMHEFGFIGVLIYLWITIRGITLILNCRRNNIQVNELSALFLYFVMGSGTLCMFNPGRIIAVPLMLYLYDFYNNQLQNVKFNSNKYNNEL